MKELFEGDGKAPLEVGGTENKTVQPFCKYPNKLGLWSTVLYTSQPNFIVLKVTQITRYYLDIQRLDYQSGNQLGIIKG